MDGWVWRQSQRHSLLPMKLQTVAQGCCFLAACAVMMVLIAWWSTLGDPVAVLCDATPDTLVPLFVQGCNQFRIVNFTVDAPRAFWNSYQVGEAADNGFVCVPLVSTSSNTSQYPFVVNAMLALHREFYSGQSVDHSMPQEWTSPSFLESTTWYWSCDNCFPYWTTPPGMYVSFPTATLTPVRFPTVEDDYRIMMQAGCVGAGSAAIATFAYLIDKQMEKRKRLLIVQEQEMGLLTTTETP